MKGISCLCFLPFDKGWQQLGLKIPFVPNKIIIHKKNGGPPAQAVETVQLGNDLPGRLDANLLSVQFRKRCTAGDIARRFDCSWPTTSRHLSTLVDAKLLTVVKEGRERIYQVESARVAKLLKTWADYFD